jgi:1-acyl-sn-glycerol-3-phosphate acyltransferase
MINKIISISFLTFIAVSSALMFLIALCVYVLTAWFDRRLVLLHLFSSFWAAMYLWVMPAWTTTVEGRDRVRKGVTYVVVSNHQSQLDILMAFSLFFPFKWVSKAEVFKLPFIGWNMVLNRYIKLYRGEGESVRQMMALCEQALAQGSSVYFFPEGTRSETGVMRPFKPGAFILAHKMKVPILPIAINGTKHALPKNSVNFHGRHHLRIRILDEIPYAAFEHLSVEDTAAMVRETIARHVDEHVHNQ